MAALISLIFGLQFCTVGGSGAVACIFIYSQWLNLIPRPSNTDVLGMRLNNQGGGGEMFKGYYGTFAQWCHK